MTVLSQSWVAISPLPIGQSALTAVCRVRTHCSDYCRLVSDVTRPLCPVQPLYNKPAVLNSRYRFSSCYIVFLKEANHTSVKFHLALHIYRLQEPIMDEFFS